jgi:hypothetical protein
VSRPLLVTLVLAVLALATAPVVGPMVAAVVAAFCVAVGGGAAIVGERWTRWITTVLGVLGGLAGTGSAAVALVRHGGDVHYADRAGFGWAAVALGLAAVAGALLIPTRPGLASALLAGGSILGFVAINLFDINTYYVLAVPLCIVAALLALAWPPRRRPARARETSA